MEQRATDVAEESLTSWQLAVQPRDRRQQPSDSMLTELLLKAGYPLTAPVEVLSLAGVDVLLRGRWCAARLSRRLAVH